VAHRTAAQLATRRRIERGIRFAAPALDLLLFAGHQLSRVAGRNELEPEPARRPAGAGPDRTPIGVSAPRSEG
jgi:hypothetical protein